MRKLLGVLALAPVAVHVLVACSVRSPQEQPAIVRVRLDNELGLLLEHPVRYAVVWTLEEDFVVTADGAVDAGLLIGSVIELPLSFPAERLRDDLDPIEDLKVAYGTVKTDIFRPRLLLYADVDRDSSFVPALLGHDGPDRILAIDDGEIGAILDLDGFLAELNLSQTEAFYTATGGRYTSFIHVGEWNNFKSAFAINQQEAPVGLSIEDPQEAMRSFDCKRGRQRSSYADLIAGIFYTPDVLVDSPLDPLAVCGLAVPNCEGVDLDSLPAPSLTDLGDVGRYQCRSGSVLEVLLVREVVMVCQGCRCVNVAQGHAYAIDPAAPPAWWPCGETVEYCASSLPLFVFAALCAEL